MVKSREEREKGSKNEARKEGNVIGVKAGNGKEEESEAKEGARKGEVEREGARADAIERVEK